LHGIEDVAYQSYREREHPGQKPTGPRLIRYADDFVVLCRTREGVDAARNAIEQWLADLGLRLSPRKTRIAHTLRQEGENAAGFDFLGFTVRQYPVSKYRAGRRNNGQRLKFVAHIKPSKQAINRHTRALHAVIQKMSAAPQAALIAKLNPLIKGWANYYRTVVAKEVLHSCDSRLFGQLWHWAVRRHPLKNRKWIAARYWNMQPGAKWQFVTKQDGQITFSLARHDTTRIGRHVKVRGNASPYDGNLLYWSQRLINHPLTHAEEARLLRRQGGRCPYCGLRLREEDMREIDHRIPRGAGGSDALANKQVLHRHCHDKKTAADAEGAYDRGWLVEELGVGKPTRPVLQTSRSREGRA
jgi:RNA-directed DNA polymerase